MTENLCFQVNVGERVREALKFALAAIDSSTKGREIFLDEYEVSEE